MLRDKHDMKDRLDSEHDLPNIRRVRSSKTLFSVFYVLVMCCLAELLDADKFLHHKHRRLIDTIPTAVFVPSEPPAAKRW